MCSRYIKFTVSNKKLFANLNDINFLFSSYLKSNATSSLLSHLSTKHDIITSPVESAISRISGSSTMNIVTNKKTILGRQIALWVARDMRPFNTASTPGFKQFAHDTGIVKEKTEIPDERTIAGSAMNDVYIVVENAIKIKLKEITTIFTLMTDIWTDNNGNRPFINISLQYLSPESKITTIDLTTEFLERPHTGEKIAEAIQKTLDRFDVTQNFYVVSDGAKSMHRASKLLKNCVGHINCIAHVLNLILSTDMEKCEKWIESCNSVIKKIKKIHGSIVYKLHELKKIFDIEQAKYIFTYLNDWEDFLLEQIQSDEEIGGSNDDIIREIFSDASKHIPKFSAFKTSNATRWNSKLVMVKSFLDNVSK